MSEQIGAVPTFYRVRLLGRGDGPAVAAGTVARAYALAVLFDPRLTPVQWAMFVRRCRRRSLHRGGLAVIEDRRGYVHAVFRYAVASAGGRRTMRLENVVLAELPGAAIVRAIGAAAELLARAFGCISTAIELPATRQGWLPPNPYAPLVARGYVPAAGPTLVRRLDP